MFERSAGLVAVVGALLLALALVSGCGRVGYSSFASQSPDAAADSGPPDADSSSGSPDTGVSRPPADPVCGDGVVNGADTCDDGNGADGDGCDNDCTFSCIDDGGCDDGALCNGSESCDLALHVCVADTAALDGTPCGAVDVCRGGACASPGCGDGATVAPEDCDDGNLIEGDGCENDCTFSCEVGSDCDDGNECTVDACLASHVCAASVPSDDGAACDRDMDATSPELCIDAMCLPARCGDGFVEVVGVPAEDCDDANSVNGDGCENDCSFSCETDADCADADVCNGTETCDVATHVCEAGTPAPDATPCAGGFCGAGRCRTLPDGGIGLPDAGGGCFSGAECSGRETCCGACGGSPGSCIPIGFSCMDVCPSDGGLPS